MARLLKNSDLQTMAKASRVPIINGCDEKYHPSQAIADLITVKEKKGKLKGVKLVYVGIHNNVCNSLVEGCTKTGVKITTVTPIFNEPSRDDELLSAAKKTGLWEITGDVIKSPKSVIYEQSENRLYSAKAILLRLLEKK